MQPQDPTTDSGNATEQNERTTGHRWVRGVGLLAIGSVLFSQPAAAQSVICQDTSGTLPGLVEGAILLIVGVGIMAAVVMYFADTLMQMLVITGPRRESVDAHKRTVYRSAAMLVVAGPLLAVMGPTLGLPFADCVDLIPF
ncbi:hypothetical protein [Salinirubrum litoreum]|uniref:Uncharacterized protein n=1 Tax=Salinirubrum litoreum TaxID=1126234 RepID=A0ABD5RBE5_9EURY|nr:hypothetical protein [Salinirubrum litoreum]